MANDFKQNLKDISDICKFEFWLRFYFLQEDNNTLYIQIPHDIIEHIQKEYPFLSGLALKLNQESLTPEKSQSTILQYIEKTMDHTKDDTTSIFGILNSRSFETEMQVYHMWVEAHSDQLESQVFDFKEWMQLFEAWKRTEKGQYLINQLNNPMAGTETDTTQ
jgi:hypothetical protein